MLHESKIIIIHKLFTDLLRQILQQASAKGWRDGATRINVDLQKSLLNLLVEDGSSHLSLDTDDESAAVEPVKLDMVAGANSGSAHGASERVFEQGGAGRIAPHERLVERFHHLVGSDATDEVQVD